MTRDLVSAAVRYTTRTARTQTPEQGWQETAWQFFSTTPEVRFGARWIGKAMSKCRLYAGRRVDDSTVEAAPAGHPATELVATIAGGPTGQAQLLSAFGPHLMVAGEGWIVIRPKERGGEDWRVLSVKEVTRKGKGLEAEIDGEKLVIPPHDPSAAPDPLAPAAIRVWEPHPEKHIEADSPVRAALGILEELQLLTAAVKAITLSRLTGRGVLIVPQGTRFPTAPGQSDAQDDLIDVFMQVAETAIRDPQSAAATVPIILEVPAEAIGDIKRITFESNFDDLALKLRDEAIRRFATGLEIPAEILLGLGDVNHWSAWALQDEAISLGVEPRLATVADALTTQWLRPLLEDQGLPDAEEWLVWYDTAPLRVAANRAQTALQVFEAGGISGRALRRETGFTEDDAPEAPAPQPLEEDPGGEELPVDETTAPPDRPAAPDGNPPEVSAGLVAAADGLIWQALHRAGEKLKKTPACPRPRRAEANQLAAAALHTLIPVDVQQVTHWGLLDDAWDRAPEIAARYGTDPECLRASLDTYCRDLISAGQPHSFEYVQAIVATCRGAA